MLAPSCWCGSGTGHWRGYGLAYAATVAWAVIAVPETLTGASYGYLSRAPAGQHPDLLGPWPQYLLVEAVLIARCGRR